MNRVQLITKQSIYLKSAAILMFICATVAQTFGQEVRTDSLFQKPGVIRERLNQSASALDSIVAAAATPDTLRKSLGKLDSIRSNFNQEVKQLQDGYKESVSKIDAQIVSVTSDIDSLKRLNLPTAELTSRIDSLNNVKNQKLEKINSSFESLKAKAVGQLTNLDLPPQYNEQLQNLTARVETFGLNSDLADLPELKISEYSLPELNIDAENLLKTGDLSDFTPNLQKIETPVGDLGQVTDQLKSVQGDIKSVTQGNLDVKSIPQAIENQAGGIDGVQELQKQSGTIDEYKTQLDALNDPSKVRERAIETVKEKAIDHFAGKEQQLKAAMDQMSKYKQRYSSVSNIKELTKLPRNSMKGRPFIERVLPGFYFQYQQKNYDLFDLNPYLSYHVSGRFTIGLGWNQRFAWDRQVHDWNVRSRIFGPRSFVDFKLGKGFIAHLEPEIMNSFVPSTLLGNPDAGKREWVWSMMTGIKKQYTVYKKLKGTVLIQYNIFNPGFKAPYADRLNSRVGFEYFLTKASR